ncbi:group II intron reverse transcriptase/maturase [Salmonella enterica]|nr:group II intron reverse transcriptase/maturase [Salmonella enterica]EGF3848901.1 group II intron reverse transcriptase/maturase [Salmonella enterica]
MNTHVSVSTIPRPAGWHAIDWRACHARVRKLQVRIAEATRQQQWRRVRELQRILTRSFSGRAVAVCRVTENTGKRTPGVDGKTWSTPDEKWKGIVSLSSQGYNPQPLRRIHIPKSNGKKRPLGIPTIRDRAMQALWLQALEPVAETTADNNSYGFRPMRSTHDAIESIFHRMSQKVSPAWVLEGDIKGCFDNISHDWLLSNIPMDKRILRKWLKAGYMEKGVFFHTGSGTPQGGIISPLLANMALDGLEGELMRTFRKSRYYGAKHQVNYVRYADDFICSGISRELLENEVKPLIEAFMQKRGLTLSEEKTAITHIEEGFDFLGQNVRKYGGKMLIKPAKKNLKNFLSKVRRLIKGNPTIPAWKLINLLNPVIRGWANYHQHIVAKDIFNYVDTQIWRAIWRWCKRRHTRKGRRWIADKYFTFGDKRWLFSAATPEGKTLHLTRAMDTPIKRHIKIRGDATPYSPGMEIYFERRLDLIWTGKLKKMKTVVALWKRQGKCCPRCRQLITNQTGWNIHHRVRKVMGGSDDISNLELLHPNCHRQVHSREAGAHSGHL